MPTCPDHWDELLATCAAHGRACARERGLFPCADGSRCLSTVGGRFGTGNLCDALIQCDNGEDEDAEYCDCEALASARYPIYYCRDGDGCIPLIATCNSRNGSRCKDGSDMVGCGGKCYTGFPEVDPYRFPCADSSQCIAKILRCNGQEDCPDGSDELGCHIAVKLNLGLTLLTCIAGVLLSFLIYLVVATQWKVKFFPPMIVPMVGPIPSTVALPILAPVPPVAPAHPGETEHMAPSGSFDSWGKWFL